jgi:HAD superfamily hydrolase (TIGR01509 family)
MNASTNNWGVIFDWDGVLVDSAQPHERSWELLAAEVGLPLPDDYFLRSFGVKGPTMVAEVLRWTQNPVRCQVLADRKEELFREICVGKGIEPLPGGQALVYALRQAGVPCAIGSSAPRANLDFLLQQFGFVESFDAIVSGEDTIKSKPEPEVFLLAATRLNLSPACCVVIEDAPVGITAAKAAGMKIVAVQTTNPRENLIHADWIVPNLEVLSVANLQAVIMSDQK